MSVQLQLRLGSFTSKRTEESLDHPVDESIDALAYSVAWHTLASSITHFSEDVGQEAAREQIPRLVASRGASFEETLRFCRSLLGGLYDLTIDAIKARQVAAAAAAEDSSRSAAAIEEWRVQRAALKILVEASLDVTGMLSSRRDAVAPSSAASSPVHPPPTPSKVALNAITSPRKPSAPNNSSSSNRSQSTTTTTNNLEESSWMAAPPPSTTGSTSMAKLCTPHTLINLLMCAYLDSMVSLVLTDVLGDAGTQEGKARAKTIVRVDDDGESVDREELDASNAFFSISMLVGTDPDDVLDKFLEYLRAAPYPLRLVWDKSPKDAARGGAPPAEQLLSPSSPRSAGEMSTPPPHATPSSWVALVKTTWSNSSRRLMIQRSVSGTMLESAGPSTPEANAIVARLWRYVA